jgi:hypothetical protein
MASTAMDPRRYRLLLRAAAAYNLVFFAWTAILPGQFFVWIGRPDAKDFYFLWQCIGLIVGCYGVGYYWAARDPGQGHIVVSVGLLGRVLSPLAWAVTFVRGGLPVRTFLVVLVTDIVWWPAFLAMTLEGGRRWSWDRCVLSIAVAAYAMSGLLLAPASTGSALPAAPWVALGWMAFSIAAAFSPSLMALVFQRHGEAFPGSRIRRVLRAVSFAAAAGTLLAGALEVALGDARPGFPVLAVANGLALLAHGTAAWRIWRAGSGRPWRSLGLVVWGAAAGVCLVGTGLHSPLCLSITGSGVVLLVALPGSRARTTGADRGVRGHA